MLFINGRFLTQDVTGVQRVAREVLGQIDQLMAAQNGAPVRVLVPENANLIDPPALRHCEIIRTGRFSGHLWEQIELPAACRKHTLLCLGNTAPLRSLLSPSTRVITMVHDLSYRYFPQAYSWKFRVFYSVLMPIILRKSDRIVTVSNAEKHAISKEYPFLADSSHFHVAANGGLPDQVVDQLHAEQLPGFEQRGYGIYVGSLSRRKNAHGVVAAAIRFLNAHPDMRFVVIGAGSEVFDDLNLSIPAAVKDRIEFWGQVNDPQRIYDALSQARFLLFPSFYEASPLPPIEAMSFGTPVICSDIPSLRERCGPAALYCDPQNIDDILAAMDALTVDRDLWTDLSRASRKRVRQFTWRAQAETLLALCNEVS